MTDEEKCFINAAMCLECNTKIRSVHRHDFTSCRCGKLAVDGGLDYRKRNYMTGTKYREIMTEEEWRSC